MPKYYCDYCDTYLTHDSPSVRKTHCTGRKHKENVRDYYQKWMEEQAQKLIDQTTAAFRTGKMGPNGAGPSAFPPRGFGMPPPMMGMPPRMMMPPGMIPPPGLNPMMMMMQPPPGLGVPPTGMPPGVMPTGLIPPLMIPPPPSTGGAVQPPPLMAGAPSNGLPAPPPPPYAIKDEDK